jgi:NRPS condensation-like uncharacterized protein
MLADDSADYPRCFSIVVRLREALEESRLREAIDAVTRRHPLLRALVAYDGDRPVRWVECPDPRYRIDWRNGPPDIQCVLERFDLRHGPGVRFHIGREPQGDSLRIEFHHASTDGVGAIQLVGDLLTLYKHGVAQAAAKLPALDNRLLGTRDNFGLSGWRRLVRWLFATFGWLGALEFLAHRPVPLGESPVATASHGRLSGFCSHTLTEGETSALIRSAKAAEVTLNDLMMRDLFLTIQAFIECHWPDRAKSHQRIMVPTNLRTTRDSELPSANVVAMVNLDRRTYRWTDRQQMLRVLHQELTAVKRLRLGVIFVQILAALQWLFGSLHRFLPTDRCQATCVASNLGVVLPHIEKDEICAVEFYPPIRPLTAAAFGVATHAGAMTVSLHYDASAMTVEQGTELLNRFLLQLQESGGFDKCAASGR